MIQNEQMKDIDRAGEEEYVAIDWSRQKETYAAPVVVITRQRRRLWKACLFDGTRYTGKYVTHSTKEALDETKPDGATVVPRSARDAETIVETWIL